MIKDIANLNPILFHDIPNWDKEDYIAAINCFKISAKRMVEKPYSTKLLGTNGDGLASIAKIVLNPEISFDQLAAKKFFEENFDPYKVLSNSTADQNGFVTGYFEPEIRASRTRTRKYNYPILRRPDDLIDIDDSNRPSNIGKDFFFARKTGNSITEYFDRAMIENGALDNRGLELFWFESRIDIFFIHIQGSARLILEDGSVHRISYAGKSGHPFTAIGKLLIEQGYLSKENVTMQSIRAWLENNPSQADGLMQKNRSYIFFQEIDHIYPNLGPVAAAGVPLSAGRSLAIDHRLHTFGSPIWVSTHSPLPHSKQPFSRLMIAQDTGSAIVGPSRGDLFIGTGFKAGQIAGAIKHKAEFILFSPKGEV